MRTLLLLVALSLLALGCPPRMQPDNPRSTAAP